MHSKSSVDTQTSLSGEERSAFSACVLAAFAWSRIRPGLSLDDVQRDFNPATRIPLRSKSRDFGQVGQQLFRALRIRQAFLPTSFSERSRSRTDSATRSTVSSGRIESLMQHSYWSNYENHLQTYFLYSLLLLVD